LDVAKRHRPLDAFFGGRRAVDLDETAITQGVAARQAAVSRRGGPLANATVNRELLLLVSDDSFGPTTLTARDPAAFEAICQRIRR
jgi:hypothetical protein